jgi:glycosyltransferase involved in cell wall biosynthesis
LAHRWSEAGADVTVLTCFPNHPGGVIPEQYRGLLSRREKRGTVNVVRTYVYAAPNKGFFRRILNYFSFMFSSVLIGSWMVKKPDILIATSPQFFVAVAGYVISKLKKCKFVFEVRDLWPEEIVAVGAIKNRLVIKMLEAIELFLYHRADLIVAVAQGTVDTLKRRGIPETKLRLLPNGVDIDFFSGASFGKNMANETRVKERLGLSGKFVVGYIGTHGMAHKLETVLHAAVRLNHNPNIQFLLVGDGADKENLVAKSKALGLPNVTFHDQISRSLVPEFYDACDLCLVPLRKANLFTRNIPSKIYEIMASCRPIIISTEGESRRLVELAGAGLGAAPEDADDLAQKILHLWKDENLRHNLARNGFSFVIANSSRNRLADNYLEILQNAVNGPAISINPNKAEKEAENNCSVTKGEGVTV